jgi:hypothetical protein
MGEYDAETFDAMLREQLHAAARAGVDGGDIASILLKHRDGVVCKGLPEHAGYQTITHQNGRDCDCQRTDN